MLSMASSKPSVLRCQFVSACWSPDHRCIVSRYVFSRRLISSVSSLHTHNTPPTTSVATALAPLPPSSGQHHEQAATPTPARPYHAGSCDHDNGHAQGALSTWSGAANAAGTRPSRRQLPSLAPVVSGMPPSAPGSTHPLPSSLVLHRAP